MEATGVIEENGSWNGVVVASHSGNHALRVVVVYDDTVSEVWAARLCHQAAQCVGPEHLDIRLWWMGSLTQRDILRRAAQAATQADVLAIALRAAEELPVALGEWIDAWLPRRGGQSGALVALIDRPGESFFSSSRTNEYLQAVALQAGLEFMLQEREVAWGRGGGAAFWTQTSPDNGKFTGRRLPEAREDLENRFQKLLFSWHRGAA